MAHAYEGQQTSDGRYLEQRRLLYGMQGARYDKRQPPLGITSACLLYTSDAADE